jgi:hypothetical protein
MYAGSRADRLALMIRHGCAFRAPLGRLVRGTAYGDI